MRDFSAIHNVCLAYCLQGIDALGVSLADLHNLAETAFADHRGQFKIIDGEWAALMNNVPMKEG